MSLSDKVSYLLDSIMLLSQIIATMISTVKFERNNLPFTIEDILKGEFNWNMYEIIPPCYVINICILYLLCFKKNMIFLRKNLLDTLMQIFIMLHLVVEISCFKFDDFRVIRTRASDLKLFGRCIHELYTCVLVVFLATPFFRRPGFSALDLCKLVHSSFMGLIISWVF